MNDTEERIADLTTKVRRRAPDAEVDEELRTMTKNFVYVEARQSGDDVSFRHVKIAAEDDDDAYLLGGRAMDTLNATNRDEHAGGSLLNDYVIEL